MIAYTTDITKSYILYQRLLRVIKTAGLLHAISLIGGLFFFGFGWLAITGNQYLESYGFHCFYSFLSVYGLALVFFSQMDAKSRFQNYKKAKDLLYENGFQPRIINLFSASRCQRDAIRVAAFDLKMLQQLDTYYKQLGYRWFHLIPDLTFSRPELFFTRRYWQRTLFEKSYKLKYFLW
jgi:hypothetical protein